MVHLSAAARKSPFVNTRGSIIILHRRWALAVSLVVLVCVSLVPQVQSANGTAPGSGTEASTTPVPSGNGSKASTSTAASGACLCVRKEGCVRARNCLHVCVYLFLGLCLSHYLCLCRCLYLCPFSCLGLCLCFFRCRWQCLCRYRFVSMSTCGCLCVCVCV